MPFLIQNLKNTDVIISDSLGHDTFMALMSLSYFDDAEKQMTPKMFASVSWDEMKAYIIKEVEKIS